MRVPVAATIVVAQAAVEVAVRTANAPQQQLPPAVSD
eukprot:SAG31_NODE_16907_length_690_cov_2.052453_2_plen_36_part_01